MIEKLNLENLEINILKAIYKDKHFKGLMFENLKGTYFNDNNFGKFFDEIKNFYYDKHLMPTKDVAINLCSKKSIDNLSFINSIYEDDFIFNDGEKNYLIDEVTNFAKRMRIIEAISSSIALMDENKGDFDPNAVLTLFKNAIRFNFNVDIGVDLFDVDLRYKRIRDSMNNKIPTGYTSINNVLRGGWTKGELFSVQGPPGFGKCSHYDTIISLRIHIKEAKPLINFLDHKKLKYKSSGAFVYFNIKIGCFAEIYKCLESGIVKIYDDICVQTPFGYYKINAIKKTGKEIEYKVKLRNKFKTIVADHHQFEVYQNLKNIQLNKNEELKWRCASDLKIGDYVYTKEAFSEVVQCKKTRKKSCMYDLEVDEVHSYFSDGFHSHNSVFLPNFGAKALVDGHNIVHYTLEMSEERYSMRYDSIISKIDQEDLIYQPDKVKARYKFIEQRTNKHLIIKQFPTGAASIYDIEAHLENLKIHLDGFTPDILIVDYGDIMKSTRKTSNTYEEQGTIFRDLRRLAIEKNVVVITATQSNRSSLSGNGSTKENVGMAEVSDSMEKNRILDCLFSIVQTKEEKDTGDINLSVSKNRNGISGCKIPFKIDYKKMLITEEILN